MEPSKGDPRQTQTKKEETVVNVEAKVKEILLEILDIKEEDIVPTASLIDDLHATSIDEAQAAQLKTVQDAIDFLKVAIAQKQAAS